MRYFLDTIKYLFFYGKCKKFLIVFLFALIPSIMLAYGIPSENFFLNILHPPKEICWGQLWLSYFTSKFALLSIFLGTLASVLSSACICGLVIRHFRIGDFNLNHFGKSFNDNAMPAFLSTAMSTSIYILMYTFYTLFAYMWYSLTVPIAYTVLSFITFFAIIFLTYYILSSLSFWLPTMCIKGIYGRHSLSVAFYQSRGKQTRLFPGYLFIILILIVTSIVSFFVSKIWYVSWIINAIGYAIAFAFKQVYILTAYFGENGLPREDINLGPYKRRN